MKGKFINKPLFSLQRKSTKNLFLIYALIITFFAVVITALYPVLIKSMDMLPAELKSLMSVNSIGEYFNTEGLDFVLLISIFASALAVNITTNEFKNGSYELIYTLNMSRGEILRTKLLRLVLSIFYMNVISFSACLIPMLIVAKGGFSIVNFIIYFLIALTVTLQVGVIIFSICLINKKHMGSFGSLAIIVVMYLFTIISAMSEEVKSLGYLSPVSALNGTIMMDGFKGIFTNGITLGVWAVISALLLIISCKKFQNDDLC